MNYCFSTLFRYVPQVFIKSRSNVLLYADCGANDVFVCNAFKELKQPFRSFSVSAIKLQEDSEKSEEPEVDPRILKDPSKDRRIKIPVETSIRYLKSEAYKEAYGDDPVWKFYRRNHKGAIPPRKTRKMCIRADVVSTGSPCPICRDEYLVVDYKNINLLKQFISPTSGEIISFQKTGLCQQQHNNLLVAYLKAKDYGLIKFDVPFRAYDYSEYQLD